MQDAGRESVRQQAIVSVQEYKKLSPCQARPCIARRAPAAVRLLHEHHVPVPGCHRRRVVRRSVVDHDRLVQRVGLRQHTFDGRAQEASLVEARDHDCNESPVLLRHAENPVAGSSGAGFRGAWPRVSRPRNMCM